MSSNGEWGGGRELVALAAIFDRPILVYDYNNKNKTY